MFAAEMVEWAGTMGAIVSAPIAMGSIVEDTANGTLSGVRTFRDLWEDSSSLTKKSVPTLIASTALYFTGDAFAVDPGVAHFTISQIMDPEKFGRFMTGMGATIAVPSMLFGLGSLFMDGVREDREMSVAEAIAVISPETKGFFMATAAGVTSVAIGFDFAESAGSFLTEYAKVTGELIKSGISLGSAGIAIVSGAYAGFRILTEDLLGLNDNYYRSYQSYNPFDGIKKWGAGVLAIGAAALSLSFSDASNNNSSQYAQKDCGELSFGRLDDGRCNSVGTHILDMLGVATGQREFEDTGYNRALDGIRSFQFDN